MGLIDALGGGDVVFHAEYDDAPAKVLAHHWPAVPNLRDITTTDWGEVARVSRKRDEELAQSLYDRYCQGLSLAQVGEEFGRSRQTVWKMFERRGWDLRPRPPARPTVEYNGRAYSIADVGYYRATSGDRAYLHRQVWEDANGVLPDDWDVHHRDHDKTNNILSNLEAMPKAEHARRHAAEVMPSDSPVVDWLTAGYP